jgi:hypothetical protein
MSEAGAVLVAPMPGDAAPVVADIAIDDGGEFDRAAAFDEMRRVTGANDSNAEEPAEVEAEAEGEPETKTDPTEEEREANRRKKLSDEKGKLSQDKLDAAFAKLTAEGKRLRGKVESFKTERATFEKAKAEYDKAIEVAASRVNKTEAEWAELAKSAETEPLRVMEKLGWNVDKLTKWILNDGKHTPEELINKTSQSYEAKLAQQAKELQDLKDSLKTRDVSSAASQYEQRAVATMESLIAAADSKYELIKNYDMRTEIAPKVLQNIAHIYREGGTLGEVKYEKGTALDPKTVLDYFEAQEAKALARHGYRPGQAGATSSVAKPGAAKPKAGLSNADTATRAIRPPVDDDDTEFDRDEAMRRVQSLFNG